MTKHNFRTHKHSLRYHEGIPVGFIHNEKNYIVNHLDIEVKLHKTEKGNLRVIGFEIEPHSIDHEIHMMDNFREMIYKKDKIAMQPLNQNSTVRFTHSIRTYIDPYHKWQSRLDHYLKISQHYEQVYHSQLTTTFLTVAVLTGLLSLIIYWVVRRDFKHLQKLDKARDAQKQNRVLKAFGYDTVAASEEGEVEPPSPS